MVLHYRESGDKKAPLMVFLHGGGVSGWMWDRQIQHFTYYHCLVPDLSGHGLSHSDTNFSIKRSAEKLIAIIAEKAEDKKVIVVGFSLGAQIIIQMASMKPDLIDDAIINSALVRPMPLANKLIKPSIKMTYPLIKYRTFAKMQAKTLYVGQDDFEKYYDESRQMDADTLITILVENMSFKIPENFNQVKGRILVTVGEKEKSMMKKSAIDIVKSNDNCQGIIIPNVGQGVPMARPDFFNTLLENWLLKIFFYVFRESGVQIVVSWFFILQKVKQIRI